jgi:DNA-binding transcriptional MerR regulator
MTAIRRLDEARARKLYSIGQVLGVLKPEFNDLTPSKLRFLEDQGLILPERTESGYRKFSEQSIDRIRIILRLQRDQYLPLKVIREHLDAMDAGRETLDAPKPTFSLRKGQRLSSGQLRQESGISEQALRESIEIGLITAQPHVAADLEVAKAIVALEEYGLAPRHLKTIKAAADREMSAITAITEPLVRRRTPESAAKAAYHAKDLAERFGAIRRSLLIREIEKFD